MTAPSNRPVLLIYRDGRIMPTQIQWEGLYYKTAEWWPGSAIPEGQNSHILNRTFRFIGEAGPYAVYAEV